MPRTDCPTTAEWNAYLQGGVPEDALPALTEHLEACPRCEAAVTEIERTPGSDVAALGRVGRRGPIVAPQPALASPQSLPARIGRFEVEAFLGEGGFGRVYRAYDPTLKRTVAVKVARPEQMQDPARVERFGREARTAANLQHPNIVAVFDSGLEGQQHYIACAFVAGRPLDAVLAERPLPLRQAAEVARKLAEALAYAHREGVIHRDVKPANVMVRPDGEPMLADFGLAARAGEGKLTEAGQVLGTPAYMAPEQWQGQASAASDQYSLGCLFYEMLTGRPPFASGGNIGRLLEQHLNQPAPSPRLLVGGLPADLETVCLKCLEKDPPRRYPDCQALADDLRRWLDGEPVSARRPGVGERLLRWTRRNPVVAGLSAALILLAVVAGVLVTWQWQRAVAALGAAEQALEGEREAQRQRSLARIDALKTATPGAVPGILEGLRQGGDEVQAALRERHAQEQGRGKKARLALALLPDESVREELVAWMLQAEGPAEVLLVRDALVGQAEAIAPGLWAKAGSADTPEEVRLRALVGLAAFDKDNQAWQGAAKAAAEQMLSANALHLGTWVRGLQPVRSRLLPGLEVAFREGKAEQKAVAAQVLAEYAADQPGVLARLLVDADEKQYAVLVPALAPHRERATALLRQVLARKPGAGLAGKERLARQQATAAATLLRLGQTEGVWEQFRHEADPTKRSYLVQRTRPCGVEARLLVQRLKAEKDASARRALIVALGEYDGKALPAGVRGPLVKLLLEWYREDGDAGMHGAIDWLLRHGREGPARRPLDWGQGKELARIDAELAAQARGRVAASAAGKVAVLSGGQWAGAMALLGGGRGRWGKAPTWEVNGQGMTLTVFPGPVPALVGSPRDEPGRIEAETQHRRRIGRSFAVATKAVTVAQWKQFLKERPRMPKDYGPEFAPEEDCPINGVNWYAAAAYCNWLSEKEGIPRSEWCYPEPVGKGSKPVPGMLKRRGYRLATEAEWEYACRAGAVTSRHSGSATELLGRYAWYQESSKDKKGEMRSWPVGQKRPNDFGLFDMHGNMFAWCHGAAVRYPRALFGPAEDGEDGADYSDRNSRVLRGGSFHCHAPLVRAADRNFSEPTSRGIDFGLRVARTYD